MFIFTISHHYPGVVVVGDPLLLFLILPLSFLKALSFESHAIKITPLTVAHQLRTASLPSFFNSVKIWFLPCCRSSQHCFSIHIMDLCSDLASQFLHPPIATLLSGQTFDRSFLISGSFAPHATFADVWRYFCLSPWGGISNIVGRDRRCY